MNNCNALFLFTFVVIFLILPVDIRPSQENKCGRIAEFSCVRESECHTNSRGTHIRCGFDGSSHKICCQSRSRTHWSYGRSPPVRTTLSAAPTTKKKKDPILIVQQKCAEYSEARYINKTIPSDFVGKKPVTIRIMDCVKSESLVHGGTAAVLKEFPHMALIGYANKPGTPIGNTQWACGGSLISDRYVLTAAHCIRSGGYEARWVRLGELVINADSDSSQPKDFRISQRIPHPQYTSSSVYFDIMLLKLAEEVKFTPYMRPICLHTSSILAESALHNKALITGWGVTATGEQTSESLLKAQIRFADDSECSATYKGDKMLSKGYDQATMICAGDKLHGRDTCMGDSGGPLQVPISKWICMYWQVGITSYGSFICGQKNVPSIYTKISPFIPWIQSVVWP